MTTVIAGAGHAGVQVAVSLRDEGWAGRIVLVGDEPDLPYQRPPLSKDYLDGTLRDAELLLRPADFYAAHGIELRNGRSVTAIDRGACRVQLDDGDELAYEHLVLATGARDRSLSLPGTELDGVVRLRTRREADALRERLAHVKRAVAIGAGFIGLEFAATAAKLGVEVDVIDIAARPLARAVSVAASAHVAKVQLQAGIRLHVDTGVRRIVGRHGQVSGIETSCGAHLQADLVLLGIGVVPNVELAESAGLVVDDGIAVDTSLRTSDPAISAIGDCASFPSRFSHRRLRLESVQNASDQARCVAARIAGRPTNYDALPWFWSQQGALRLQIAGLTSGHDLTVLRGDPDAGSFSVMCFRDARLVGVESFNRPVDHLVARRLLAAGTTLTPAQAADVSQDLKTLTTSARHVHA